MHYPESKCPPFAFDELVNYFRSVMAEFPDKRTGTNTRYSMEDVVLGAFALFFTQSPSFLAFQRRMHSAEGISNAQTLFQIDQIPCDNHIRDVLDEVHPSHVLPVFSFVFDNLKDSGLLEEFRSINNTILIALDGTQYFTSQKIHCENCSTQKHKNGTTTYSHSVVTPVIVAPGNSKVIALQPEFITPQDGHDKQDCENAAAKRWIRQYASQYVAVGSTLLGDDLYCCEPLCKTMRTEGFDFILVCKPKSHKTLYTWIEERETEQAISSVVSKHRKGKVYEIVTYRFINQAPLRDGDDALKINWCEITITRQDGTVRHKNAFATNHAITKENVSEIVAAGRSRWKVENENNNTLKTKGYHLEHNFGHGEKHLSSLLLTFNLLAFLFHTLLGMVDDKYQLIRNKLVTRKTFFNDIRALTRYICFPSWEEMLNFMMRGLRLEIPDT